MSQHFASDASRDSISSLLIEHSPSALFWAAHDGTLRDVNRAFLDLFGKKSREEVIGKVIDDLCADPLTCRAAFDTLATNDVVLNISLQPIGGSRREALLSLRKLPADGPVDGVTGTIREITDWKATLDAEHEEAEQYRTIALSMSEGAVLLSAGGDILACNPSAERILGLTADQMVGRSTRDPRWRTIYEDGSDFPADHHPVVESLQTGERRSNVLMGVHHPDGTLVWIRINSTPLFRPGESKAYAVMSTFTDVTEQRALEAQFLQTQKLEALGQLSGGIAHDFNNMLTVIFHRCELLLRRLPPADPLRKSVQDMHRAAQQSAELTQQLLAAARKQVLHPKIIDVGSVIRETIGLFTRSIGEHISIDLSLADDIWRIRADPGKLRQAVLNLVVNARDAMPGGGVLTIEVRNFLADAAYIRVHPQITHGEYVTLTVSDNGCGIALENRTRIYDPFFTTKPVGKGSGLGLAVVRGIVEQTGGHITVYSEVGRGTSFKLYFPRTEGDVENLLADAVHLPALRGTETLLVVEDDDLVRSVLSETLVEQGYSVLVADSPAKGFRLAEEHSGHIHLLLTDVMMPGSSGRDLAQKLVTKRPNLHVIYMSGFTDDAIVHHGVLDEGVHFLQKPVTASQLLTRVREVLDGAD